MKKLHYIIILFISVFINLNVLADATFVDSFDVANEEDEPRGLTFNNNGTRMYVTGWRGDDVNEYRLTTPFDVSTATFVQTNGFTINSDPRDVKFNPDGTRMFVLGRGTIDRVFQLTLTTPFDISTAVAGNDNIVTFNTNAQETSSNGLAFNLDGTRMFIVGENSDFVNEYTLTTGFDISTATYAGDDERFFVRNEEGSPIDIDFNGDGSRMYIVGWGGNDITEYTLTTRFDVSTAVAGNAFSVATEDTDPAALAFSGDGTKMFVIGDVGNDINEYDLSCFYGVITGNCPDPTVNQEVLGAIEAQTAAPKRIVQHVTTPLLNRMYWLRRYRNEDKLSNQNIKFNFSNSMMASLSKVIPVSNKTNDALDKLSDNWSFWSEGSVSVGKVDGTAFSSPKDINSNGITLGMDKKISENRLYGYAFRFGKDDVDIGTFTSLNTNSYSLSLYGTFPHDDKKFTEGIVGISSLKMYHVTQGGGTNRTGERSGRQIFGSINYLTTYHKEKFNITPNGRVDISYTDLSEYSETGNSALRHNKQKIETGKISAGFTLSDIINFNTMTFKPNGGLEFGLDFSPSSDATYSYVSETTEYTKSIGQDSKNIRANIGFDLITENGFSIMSIYERNQSNNAHYNTFYLALGYIPYEDIEYAMSLDDDKAVFDYTRNFNGFDVKFDTGYDLFKQYPDYEINLNVSSKF